MKKICLIGTFDTKGPEYAFVREKILARGQEVLTVNTGVMGSTDLFPVDVEADKVAEAGGGNLDQLREKKDRGDAMKIMCAGAPAIVKSLYDEGEIDGILGMGGTGGTTVVTSAILIHCNQDNSMRNNQYRFEKINNNYQKAGMEACRHKRLLHQ